MAPSLDEMLRSALGGHDEERRPERLGPVETENRLREHIAALNRPTPMFKQGDRVRFKADLHMNLYSQENQVFVFFDDLEEPINPIDYAESVRDALSPFSQFIRDCRVLGLDSDNEVVSIPVCKAWLEVAE